MDALSVFLFARHCAGFSFCSDIYLTSQAQRWGGECRSAHACTARDINNGPLVQRPVLVRVPTELAKWIPLHRGRGGTVDFPAIQRVARIKAGRFAPQRNRRL